MANIYFSHNRLPIGFVVTICVLFVYKYLEINSQDEFPIFVNNSEDYTDIDMTSIENKAERIDEIKEIINRRNEDSAIINNILRTSVQREYLAVIVVKVRSNTLFFESFIQSLEAVFGIRKTLLIFSHETYDDHINEIVKNITFTSYIQIYYPHSIQLRPKAFSGEDPKLCLDDLNCKMNNGRRNATLVQNKLHWWWTVSFAFDHLKPVLHYNGTIVFLEDDEYVAKDFIYILNMLEYAQPTACPQCIIFGLAIVKPNITEYYQRPSVITVSAVGSTEDLIGIGFNRTAWREIKKLDDLFCGFNDVDWTRSLVYSLTKSPNKTYSMLSIDGPRVFRFDILCTSYNCGDLEKVEIMQAFMSKIKNGLFPKNTVVRPYKEHVVLNISKGHGGWDDARDYLLCKDFTRKTRRERC